MRYDLCRLYKPPLQNKRKKKNKKIMEALLTESYSVHNYIVFLKKRLMIQVERLNFLNALNATTSGQYFRLMKIIT